MCSALCVYPWERVSLRDRLNRISNNDVSIHSVLIFIDNSKPTISMLNQCFLPD